MRFILLPRARASSPDWWQGKCPRRQGAPLAPAQSSPIGMLSYEFFWTDPRSSEAICFLPATAELQTRSFLFYLFIFKNLASILECIFILSFDLLKIL